MCMMSLTALFTALGAEVMSHSEDAFELDRLSTVILSQEYAVLLTPLKYLKILKKEEKNLRISSWGIYSSQWNIGYICIRVSFLFSDEGVGGKFQWEFVLLE